jgi:hypothetical protein
MPNGVFPVPTFRDVRRRSPRRSADASLALRLRTLWHRDRLDDQLARGVDPTSSQLLELRADQLLAKREELADTVDDVVIRAKRPFAFSVEVHVRRHEVDACADDLHALARRLRDGEAIDVHGVAMTWTLLTDGASPLYHDSGVALRYAVRSARLALDPMLTSTVEELASAA